MTVYEPPNNAARSLTVRALVGDADLSLDLSVVAGANGLDRLVDHPRIQKSGLALVGHPHGIVPTRIQILGETEISYIESLPAEQQRGAARHLFQLELSLVIVTRGVVPPLVLVEEAHRTGSWDELLLTIGYGKLETEDVVRSLRSKQPEGTTEPPPELKTGRIEQLVRKVTGKDVGGIRVSGVDDVLVRYAKCCNPLPGDTIIGFITRGRGVTIHRRECVKAFDTDPERRIDVSWDTKAKINRPVQLKVTTTNKPGILANVSQTFSAQKINISEANCRAQDDGRACNVFTFHVGDLTQLKNVMKALTKVQGVVDVERV